VHLDTELALAQLATVIGIGGFFTFGGRFVHCSGVRIASGSFAACCAMPCQIAGASHVCHRL
jgi:hypothetical protein